MDGIQLGKVAFYGRTLSEYLKIFEIGPQSWNYSGYAQERLEFIQFKGRMLNHMNISRICFPI